MSRGSLVTIASGEPIGFMSDHDILHPNPIRGLRRIPGMLVIGGKVRGAPCVAWNEDTCSIIYITKNRIIRCWYMDTDVQIQVLGCSGRHVYESSTL